MQLLLLPIVTPNNTSDVRMPWMADCANFSLVKKRFIWPGAYSLENLRDILSSTSLSKVPKARTGMAV